MKPKNLDKLIKDAMQNKLNSHNHYATYGQFKQLSYLEELNYKHENKLEDQIKALRVRQRELRFNETRQKKRIEEIVKRKRLKRKLAERRATDLIEQEDFKFRKFIGGLTPQEKLMQRVNTWRGLRWAGFSTSIIYTIITLSILL